MRWLMTIASPPPAPADPEELRRATERVLERGGDFGPSWFERLLERLGNIFFGGAGGSAFAGGIGPLLALLVALVLVAVLVLAARAAWRGRGRRRRRSARRPVAAVIDRDRPAPQWDDDAARAEAEGRWRDAVRAHYAAMIRRLTTTGRLPDGPGWSSTALARQLAITEPSLAGPMAEATVIFEDPWFGGLPTGPEPTARLRVLAATIVDGSIAAPHTNPDDTKPDDTKPDDTKPDDTGRDDTEVAS